MIDTGDLRKGLIIEHDGALQRIIDYQHVKQGRGSAFVRLTMRNLRTGSTTQQTFQAGSRFPLVRLERQRVQYLYPEDEHFVFMDLDTFEQFSLSKETLGDALNYLEEGMPAEVVFYEGKAISVELPTSVVREVTWTEPAVKGDTSGKVLKPAKISTGFDVPVPIFVEQGDKIEIDTRTAEYRKRV